MSPGLIVSRDRERVLRETTPACPAYPGGQPMLRRRFDVPSATDSYGARFSAVHESKLVPRTS
jgi:hypothetical protein